MSYKEESRLPDIQLRAELEGLFSGSFELSVNTDRLSHSGNKVFCAIVKSAEVAVKAFKGEPYKDTADHEAFMMDYVRGCGIRTLEPTTLCIGSLANYLLTIYEPDITPLDQANLDRLPKHELQETSYVLGSTLGRLHSNGIVHGDPQLKNFFITPEGEIGATDFEQSELYMDPADPGYRAGCNSDLLDLLNSMTGELISANPLDYKMPAMEGHQDFMGGSQASTVFH